MAVRFPNMVLPFFAALLRDVNEQWREYYDIDYAKSNIWRNILRSPPVRTLPACSNYERTMPAGSVRTDTRKLVGNRSMKAKVYVTLKTSVLDPQGKAIKHSVELLGFEGIDDIRQGKYFEVALDGSLGEAKAREQAEALARDVLSNPIIEDFRVEIEK